MSETHVTRVREALRHPFWQAVALLAASYVVFTVAVPYLPPLVGMKSAPVPASVLFQYMVTALVGILIYVSDNEERWRRFQQPIAAVMVEADKKRIRAVLLVLLPLTVGFVTWRRVRPRVEVGAQLRSIHPSPPSSITFRGSAMTLAGLENPLRSQGEMARHLATGRRVYYENCVPCHGDRFDGQGHFAAAFNPPPLSFTDPGTIAQLTESFVFWRIAKGGPGLPSAATPWNSAMPAWEEFLTEEEIWAVVLYLYEHTGWRPRTWEAEASEHGGAGGNDRADEDEVVLGSVVPLRASTRPSAHPPATPQASPDPGRAVYDKWCAGCHGETGRGDGPAAAHLLPKPRDFARALYQVRTTATGEVPADADIRRVVDEGMPGTSMPGWRATLSGDERAAVVAYVKSFSTAFQTPPTTLTFGSSPGGGQAAIDSGRALYRKIECFKCHGQDGRGDGQSAPTLKDDFNNPIRAADLTRAWLFNGGSEVEDIYRRLRSGLDGTPMPSFGDLVDANVVSDGDLWRVAMYVRSLSPDEPPAVRDAVRADLVQGALPAAPTDSAWAGVEPFFIPLVGQVIARPRVFAPTASGVFVQAVHDGRSLAVRVSWDDPSESPDTSWNVWRARMARVMANDSVPYDTVGALPDRLVVQFPTRLPTGLERPYFLLGSGERPVYLWDWQSQSSNAVEALGRGVDRIEPLAAGADTVQATAVWERGRWSVQFVRALVTADSTDRIQLVTGTAIPMAVFAWDGSNSETGARMALGSWNAIYLAEPVSAGVYLSPVVATLATALIAWLLVRRAQRKAMAG